MKRAVLLIILLMIVALSLIARTPMSPVKALGGTLTLSDTELMLPEFAWEFDPGSSLTGKTDVSGPGVQFDLANLGKAGIGDNFPVNALAGGTGPHNGDFTAYNKYSMLFVNLGSNPISAALFMNTGWTTSPQNGTYDTFWSSIWVPLDPHQGAIVTLDFSNCGEVWNAEDDPMPEWRHPNGSGGWPVRRLDQVSNIGFMVIGGSSASVLVSGTLTRLYVDPPVVNKKASDVCTFFNVYVTLENFASFAGFDIKLTWNGTLITRSSVDYATYLNALWGVGKWSVPVEESGVGFYRIVAVALATSASNLGASVLFKMSFHVDRGSISPLQTPIHFESVKLSDDAEPIPNPIYAEVVDGMYYMSSGTRLYVNPANVERWTVSYGQEFSIDIKLANVTNLFRYDFQLYWGTDLLDLVGVQVTPPWTDYLIVRNETNEPSGEYWLVVEASGVPTFNGSTMLAKLEFKITYDPIYPEDRTCSLNLANTNLTDKDGLQIYHTVNDGKYSIYSTRPRLEIRPTIYLAHSLGETFWVEILLYDIVNLYNFTFKLNYDTTLLDATYMQIGPFVNSPYYVSKFIIDDANGEIWLGIWLVNPAPPVTGSGELAIITFKVTRSTLWRVSNPNILSCILDLHDTMLKTNTGVEVPHDIDDGVYYYLPKPGDLDCDGHVGLIDLRIVAYYYEPAYNSIADINEDGVVDDSDISIVVTHYGEDC